MFRGPQGNTGSRPGVLLCALGARSWSERRSMAQCVTCGSELHPERAEKYDYCMAPECQEKNLKGLTMVAIGVNKSAEQYLVLDEHTQDELASGKYHDQRRGSFGTSAASAAPAPAATSATAGRRAGSAQHGQRSQRRPASPPAVRRPWSRRQEKLALLYNEQGRRPEEIAQKLGLSPYTVTQIILTSRNRGKL
jgi:DNA-binding CsgD family transcriptional regulator